MVEPKAVLCHRRNQTNTKSALLWDSLLSRMQARKSSHKMQQCKKSFHAKAHAEPHYISLLKHGSGQITHFSTCLLCLLCLLWLSRLTSYVLRLTSYVLRLTSYVLRLTSYLLRLTSYLLRLTPRLPRRGGRLPARRLRLPSPLVVRFHKPRECACRAWGRL